MQPMAGSMRAQRPGLGFGTFEVPFLAPQSFLWEQAAALRRACMSHALPAGPPPFPPASPAPSLLFLGATLPEITGR